MQAVIDGHTGSYQVEHPVRRKDGTVGWVHVQGERVSAPGETPLRIVGSTVDITERKRFERQLQLTQFAVDHSPNAIFWIDGQGRVVRGNEQAARSLLSNAEKFNRPQGRVSIVCAPAAGTPPAVRIHVSDTGPGLTAAQCARLFVPFERLQADERQIEGTGIGLALSKRLVELMGGDIGVDSASGHGSSFWVQLPLAQGDGTVTDGREVMQTAPPAPAGAAARVDVLCIEDNPANRRLMEAILGQRPDIHLLTAISPGLGLELARTRQPALILLDIHLPDMDGYAVLQRLRDDPSTRDIPVVAVSANAMPRDLDRARAAGFAADLTKPADVAALLQQVEALITRRR